MSAPDDHQATTSVGRPDFATLVDSLEGRLPAAEHHRVETQLRHADPATTRTVSWIRGFHRAARRYAELQPPDGVRTALHESYLRWWAERSQTQTDTDWDELAARLIFDSRRTLNLAGVRGIVSAESVQLAYALGDVDVVIDLMSYDDGAVRVDGQVLATESHPAVTALGVALRGTDEESRTAELDQFGQFTFDRVLGPDLEVLVRAGRRRWRLPLSPHRTR